LNRDNWLNLNVLSLRSVLTRVSIVALVSTLTDILSRWSLLLLLIVSSVIVKVVLRSILIVIVVVLEGHATVELLLDKEENLLNKLNGVRSLEEVRVNLIGSNLLSLVVEISSILSLSLLLFADLRELVVSNVKLLSIEWRPMQVTTSVSCAIRLLKADKGTSRGLAIVSRKDLDALNFSISGKVRSQIFNSELHREVLHEKVALLLGVLEPLLLSLDHTLSLNGGKSWLHIEFAAINFLIVEFLDSFLGRDKSSFFVIWVLEANESKLAQNNLGLTLLSTISILSLDLDFFFLGEDGFDESKLAEDLLNLLLVPLGIKVLDVDIVRESLDFLGVLRIKFNCFDGTKLFAANDSSGVLLVFKADETVANGLAGESLVDHVQLLALLVGLYL
jgi:hypothetical protein